MSIGWAVAILLLMLAVFFFHRRQAAQVAILMHNEAPRAQAQPVPAVELPAGYYFHPSHTWMAEHRKATALVGMDGFAANLIGRVQQISVVGEQRWVRQGQKLMTVAGECGTFELLSPVEGVLAAVNPEVIKDPDLAARDPYGRGWICQIKPSEMETDQRNLMQGPLAERWLENSFQQLKSSIAEADPTPVQDGGQLLPGAFNRLSAERREALVKEVFQG